MRRALSVLMLLSCTAVGLMAHEGHGQASFAAGFAHPFGGLDHFLAMLAVGLLGARYAARWRWLLPTAFVVGLGLGGLLTSGQLALPGTEMAVASTLLLFGAVLACATRIPAGLTLALVLLAALPHGHAHLTEAGLGSAQGYGLGMILGSSLLHLIGVSLGLAVGSAPAWRDRWQLLAGPALAASGLVLAAQIIL